MKVLTCIFRCSAGGNQCVGLSKCSIPLQSGPGPWHKLLVNKYAQGIQLCV